MNVILTERDLDILQFVCEMKFARTEDIYLKFFKNLKSGNVAASDLWARKRLFQLEKGGFLKSRKLPGEKSTFYTATNKAFMALKNISPEKALCTPLLTIDYRTYGHDLQVLKCRLLLEENRKIPNWISDRMMKQNQEFDKGFGTSDVPDGLFLDSEGRKFAFELEISRKSKSKYLEKIKNYSRIIRYSARKPNFESVIFVCADLRVCEILKEQTKIYGEMFRVLTLSEFKDGIMAKGNT